jgi:hypothetical protein
MPQRGVPFEVFPGSASMVTVAFGGEETVWGLGLKLGGELNPCAINHDGCQGKDAIPQTMQLIVGRTGQEYNQRKNQRRASGEKSIA